MPWNVVVDDSQVLAIHAALVFTGGILYFGGDEHNQDQHDKNIIDNTRLFDVATNRITSLGSPTTDVFCSGHAFLADGRLLVAGGTEAWGGGHAGHPHALNFGGHRACWLYNPQAARPRAWQRAADMNFEPGRATGGGRWYPTLVTLASGHVLAAFGHPSLSDGRHRNGTPEVYSPASNTWTLLSRIDEGIRDPPTGGPHLNYPRLHVLPNSLVFFATPVNGNRFYDPEAGIFLDRVIEAPGDPMYQDWSATSVLLPLLPNDDYTPRVLICGGRQPQKINLGERSPAWQNAGNRAGAAADRVRANLCAVILPTGDIFLSGGVAGGSCDPVDGETQCPVREGEIYSPGIDWETGAYTGAENWMSVEAARVPRNYHSVALLMPNGRVWTAGSSKNASSGDPAAVGEMRIEVYRPAYDATRNRPEIRSSPTELHYGEIFEVRTPQAASIRRVALLRAGSVTHAFDADQRYVGLVSEYRGRDLLHVVAPAEGGIAPPGPYMLWIVDNAGRPCKLAKFVRLNQRYLHLAGITRNGRLWHTIRRPHRWLPFGDVEREAGERGNFVDIDCAEVNGGLHVACVTSDGRLWHTIRRPDRWLPFGDVKREAGDRGSFVRVGIAEVGDLHVTGVTSDGRLWHTIRRPDRWLPFGDVEREAGERGNFVDVDCAGIEGELHVAGVTSDGRLWHTIRRMNGSWFPFGDVEEEAGERGVIRKVACAEVASELHVCSVAEGRLWHTIRRTNGSWFPFGDVEREAGERGHFMDVDCAEVNGDLHVAGTTNDWRLWHTIRRTNGSWLPFGDVEREAGERGSFVTAGMAALFTL